MQEKSNKTRRNETNNREDGLAEQVFVFREVMTIDKEISESHEGGWGGLKETTSEHVCLHTCIYGLRQNE